MCPMKIKMFVLKNNKKNVPVLNRSNRGVRNTAIGRSIRYANVILGCTAFSTYFILRTEFFSMKV